MPDRDNHRKVAIITGAASGQGAATARALVRHGAHVMAADIDEEGLALLGRKSTNIAVMRCDMTWRADVEALVEATEEQFGALQAMLNCARYLGATGPLIDTTEQMLDRIIDINFKEGFYGCQASIPARQSSGGGAIVNWGPVNSLVAEPEIAAYSATKGAILMITKSVAVEYAKYDIRANCLCTGGVITPMVASFFDDEFPADEQAQRGCQPQGLISPDEVAEVAVFLVSDESRKLTGSAVMVDAGYTAS